MKNVVFLESSLDGGRQKIVFETLADACFYLREDAENYDDYPECLQEENYTISFGKMTDAEYEEASKHEFDGW